MSCEMANRRIDVGETFDSFGRRIRSRSWISYSQLHGHGLVGPYRVIRYGSGKYELTIAVGDPEILFHHLLC